MPHRFIWLMKLLLPESTSRMNMSEMYLNRANGQNENTMCTDHCLKHLFRWGSGERLALNGKASPTTRLEIFPVNDFADCRTLHRGNGNGDNYTMPYKLYF